MVNYQIPEVVPFMLSNACLDVTLKSSDEAKKLFEDVLKATRLPDCVKAIEGAYEKISDNNISIDNIVIGAAITGKMPIDNSQPWMPNLRSLIGLNIFIRELLPQLTPLADLHREQKSADFGTLYESVNRFIRESFNNKANKSKGIYKITAKGSPLLFGAVMLKAVMTGKEAGINSIGDATAIINGKKAYSINDLVDVDNSSRLGRFFVGQFREAGWEMFNNEKIKQDAERWYGCRVAYSGPLEYCMKVYNTTQERLDSGNVSKEIKECDKAMCYPRKSR